MYMKLSESELIYSRIVKKANLSYPPQEISGFDMKANLSEFDGVTDAKNIKIPELGVYAIYGNHEYPGEKETAENMKKIGFNLLTNENRKVTINNEKIYIAGVTDLWHGKPDAEKALESTKKEDFVLFLTHNPEYFEQMSETEKGKTDMILAGHTHAGQVTFFGKIIVSAVKDKKKYGYGMKEYGGHKIYITSGVGGAFLEMFIRFFAQPEIVIFELKRG